MPYFKPIISKNKTDENPLVSPFPAADDLVLNVDNSTNIYAVDDRIFISESDDTENQFLGKVKAEDSTTITVSIPVELDKSAGSKIWKPTVFHHFTQGPGDEYRPFRDSGVRSQITLGNKVYRTRTRDPIKRHRYRIPESQSPNWNDFEEVMAASFRGGLDSITWAFWDHSKQRPRCMQATINNMDQLEAQIHHRIFESFVLDIIEEVDDTYVTD